MVQDYKDVAFSFQKRKTRRRRQRLKLALLVLALLALFCGYRFLRVSAAVGNIQDLLLAGRAEAAGKKMAELSSPFFLRGPIRELCALGDLFGDRLPQAQARFDELKGSGATTSLRSGQFQKYFFDRGEYPKLKIYADYLQAQGGDENTWFYALVQSALFNSDESEKAVARLSPGYRKNNAKALALLDQVNADLRRGRINYIFDRNGLPLAYFDARRRKTHPLLPGLNFGEFDLQVKKGLSYFRLTLDTGLQMEIGHLFNDYFGTLVLLGLPENEILAAYSKPRSARTANAAFSEGYEPGSIVKIVSLLAYLRQTDQGMFPYDCPGRIALGKRVFYDGMAHKQVLDYAAALARSCNIAFARMGLHVGPERLGSLLEAFHFNARPFDDWLLQFQTGAFKKKLADDYELANLAVGLNEISLTTIHAAVLAATFSQNGLLYPPFLIEDAKNILDLGYYNRHSRPLRVLTDDLNFRRVKKAIREILGLKGEKDRRAMPATAELAVKTGIAGDPQKGLDALAIGFFPYEQPRFAFAYRLEGAGKSELDGAEFLRSLLNLLQQKK